MVKVIRCRISGKVIVTTLEIQEMKEVAMERKSRQKEGKVFIENDLSWKERKTQEEIYKWVKEES